MAKSQKLKSLKKSILREYALGVSPSRICINFGLSERGYTDIVQAYRSEFDAFKAIRRMNQKKKRDSVRTNLQGEKADPKVTPKKLNPEEKLAELEKKLQQEQKKNQQLQELLNIAKEQLGKP